MAVRVSERDLVVAIFKDMEEWATDEITKIEYKLASKDAFEYATAEGRKGDAVWLMKHALDEFNKGNLKYGDDLAELKVKYYKGNCLKVIWYCKSISHFKKRFRCNEEGAAFLLQYQATEFPSEYGIFFGDGWGNYNLMRASPHLFEIDSPFLLFAMLLSKPDYVRGWLNCAGLDFKDVQELELFAGVALERLENQDKQGRVGYRDTYNELQRDLHSREWTRTTYEKE